MSPRVDFNRRGMQWSCVTARRNLFSLRVNPYSIHTSLHVRRPGCLCGVWAGRQTGNGAKRKRQCPGYTLPPLHEHNPPSTPPPPSTISSHPFPLFQAAHIGQTSLRFHASECDSSSPPACDGPNSGGLPTHRVVSPSVLLILGSRCAHAQGLPMSDFSESPKSLTRKVIFLSIFFLSFAPCRRTSSARCGERVWFVVSRICIRHEQWKCVDVTWHGVTSVLFLFSHTCT